MSEEREKFLAEKLAKVSVLVQDLRNIVDEDEDVSVDVDNALTAVEDCLVEDEAIVSK